MKNPIKLLPNDVDSYFDYSIIRDVTDIQDGGVQYTKSLEYVSQDKSLVYIEDLKKYFSVLELAFMSVCSRAEYSRSAVVAVILSKVTPSNGAIDGTINRTVSVFGDACLNTKAMTPFFVASDLGVARRADQCADCDVSRDFSLTATIDNAMLTALSNHYRFTKDETSSAEIRYMPVDQAVSPFTVHDLVAVRATKTGIIFVVCAHLRDPNYNVLVRERAIDPLKYQLFIDRSNSDMTFYRTEIAEVREAIKNMEVG